MKYQDGTHPRGEPPQAISEEKKKWWVYPSIQAGLYAHQLVRLAHPHLLHFWRRLTEAMAEFTKDLVVKMKEIKSGLDSKDAGGKEEGEVLREKEELLDHLVEIVEDIDYARDLQTIGGLPTLLTLLESEHPSLRWRSAGETVSRPCSPSAGRVCAEVRGRRQAKDMFSHPISWHVSSRICIDSA
jgi:hypothetical protein